MPQILLYINPDSGGRRGQSLTSRAIAHLRRLGFDGEVHNVREGLLPAEPGDRIILIGGDGTLHHALPELLRSKAVIGIIPAGTGNDFARSLGLPLDPVKAAEAAWSGHPQPIDAGLAGSTPFLGIACFGIDSDIAERTRGSKQSKWAYIAAALRALAVCQPREVRVSWDGGKYEGPVMLAAAANSSRYGNNMILAPDAGLSDGLLDLVLVKSMPRLALLRLFATLARGKTPEHPGIIRAKTRQVRMECIKGGTVFADGEPAAPLPVDISVKAAALRIAVP